MAEATTMKILKRGIDVCSFEPFRGSKRIRTSYKLNLEYNNGGTFKGATVSCAQGEHKSKSSSALSVCNQICYQTASAIVDAPAQKRTRLTVKTQGAALPLPWHAPWKNYRVISGHTGWVRAIAFDPGNLWFCTGSADQTIRIWDVATGRLKITLTGHIGSVRALAVSPHHTYMFSAGDDKQVKCWDLEQNKVIRSYHGHLSGVRCLSLHPTLDSVLFTGGRDSVCRVWDVRTKMGVHTLSGHTDTVSSLLSRPTDPQIITGSQDGTIRLWDIRHGKTMVNLTHHKKGVRAMAELPKDHSSFASASVDNIKKFNLPKGDFVMNMSPQQKTIINALDVNEDGVMATGGDNGSLWLWDWKHGYNFQQEQTIVQPGSLESECCIYALSFDKTGSRLVTCEADKTIKMWKQDESATPQTHPIAYKMPKGPRRF